MPGKEDKSAINLPFSCFNDSILHYGVWAYNKIYKTDIVQRNQENDQNKLTESEHQINERISK